MTSVGTSMRATSLRKSSCQVGTQARLAVGEALAATFHFASTHRESNQRKVAQLKMSHKFVQVLGESIVVVIRCWLTGFSEPSSVIRDHAMTGLEEHRELFLPGGTA